MGNASRAALATGFLAISGGLVGGLGYAIVDSVMHPTNETPILQIKNAAPGSSDARFNDFAKSVHYMDGGVPSADDSTRQFQRLANALLTGEIEPSQKHLEAAIGLGESMSASLHSGATFNAKSSTLAKAPYFLADASNIEASTTALKAKLASLSAKPPTIANPNPANLAGPSVVPPGTVK